jgi:O-antigen/teichoic acid export membrane protein
MPAIELAADRTWQERDAVFEPGQGARADFRSGFAWMLAANGVYAACQWAMLAVLAKLCAPAEMGVFALGLAVTAPVIVFSNLQLRVVQATDVRGNYAFGEYVRLRLWTTAGALAVIAGIAVMQPRMGAAALVMGALGLSKGFESLSDVLYGYLQKHERMDVIARSLMIKGVVSIALMGLATLWFRTAFSAAIGVALASGLLLALYDVPATVRLRALVKREAGAEAAAAPARVARIWSLAGVALPLGVTQGLVSLSANIPRYQLEGARGLAELGIFSALASLIVLGQTVVSALGNVVSPRLARLHAAGDYAGFVRLLLSIAALGAGMGAAGIVFAAFYGGPLLSLLFSPEYGAHADVLVFIMTGATFAYVAWFAGFGLTAAQLFRQQMPLLAAVCASAWAAGLVLIPSYGASGAAMALTVSMGVQALGAALILWYALRTGESR